MKVVKAISFICIGMGLVFVKIVRLTLTGSTVNLKDGGSFQTDSIEQQGDIAEAAKEAGIPYSWD